MAFNIKKVLGNVAQSLSDAEKLQARQNMDAAKIYTTDAAPTDSAEFERWKSAIQAGVPIVMELFGIGQYTVTSASYQAGPPEVITLEYIEEHSNPSRVIYSVDVYSKSGGTVTYTNREYDVSASGQGAIVSTTPINWWANELTFNSSMFDQQNTGYQDIGKTYTVQPGQILQFFINTSFKIYSLSYANGGSFSDHTWDIMLHTTGNNSDIKSKSSFCSAYLQAGQSMSDSELKPVSATLMYKNTTSSPISLDVALMTSWGSQYLTGSIQLKDICIGDVVFS